MRHNYRLELLERQAEAMREGVASTFPGPWGAAQMARRAAENEAVAVLGESDRAVYDRVLAWRDPMDIGVRWWGGPKAPDPVLLAPLRDGSIADVATRETAYTAGEWAVCRPVLMAAGKLVSLPEAHELAGMHAELEPQLPLGAKIGDCYIEDFSASWGIRCLDGIPWPSDAVTPGRAA